MSTDYTEFESKMKKTASVLTEQYDSVRAGKANPAVLDRITVDYYGSPTPIQQIASVSTPDARSLLIQPWDASVLKGIEKAILASDLGLNPQNDGRTIRLIFPALTEERRRDLVKQVKKYGEEAKVAVRNIRRDAMDKFKAQKKKSEITEDDLKIIEKDLQKLTDDYIKEMCIRDRFFMIGPSRLSFSRVQRSFHAAKAPVAPLELRQGRVHVALGKVRPEHVGEIQLRVRALPGQEVTQALLSARADDEVGVRNAGRIQIAAEHILRELRRGTGLVGLGIPAHGVQDLSLIHI